MSIYQKNTIVSDSKKVNSITAFAALFVAMFIVMASFGVMAAGSMNATAPTAITNPTKTNAAWAVNLGSAGNFTVFGNTGITNVVGPLTLVTGDIGAGPAVTSTAITGFDLTAPPTTYSTSAYVTGKVYAHNFDVPTPGYVEGASANMSAAYLNASGQTHSLPDASYLNIGNPTPGTLTDYILAPGVYEWGTAVTIPTDITLNGSATDVWIFKIAGTFDMAAAKNVLLINGAVPENIFWQVSGAITIGANSHFEGIVLGMTAITFGNGASIDGRLLAQTAVNLDANAVTQPAAASASAPVSAVDPIAPYWNNAGTQNITATGSDCDSIDLYYRFSADNTTWDEVTMFGNDTAAPWYWDFDFTNGTGYYEFYSKAWNSTDGVREDSPILADAFCAYDMTAPTSACNVAGAYLRNTSPIIINATASDATSGIAGVSLWYRYGAVNGTFGAWNLSSNDTMAPYSFSFSFDDGQGFYEFYSIATDNASVAELAPGAADVRYAFDNVLPVSNVNSITPYVATTSPKTIIATANDVMSDIANVTLWYAYSVDNVTFGVFILFGTDNAAPWSWDFNFPSGSGYYRFYTIATDNVENVELAPVSADAEVMYDVAGPMIIASTPIDNGTSISINPDTYVIHFNEGMDTTVGTMQTTMPGTSWSWSADMMWYNSTYTVLQLNTKYYVNLTGFTDLAGNALSGDMNLTFTTETFSGSVRLPVDLGTAGDFTILAKTAISTTGVTLITGDMGVSPAAATYITGFGLILDPSTTFSTSSLVVGKVYAADYTPPTPAKMTTAVSDMETAYTDAAGRTTPDYTELGAGDITGMNLSPGLYKWDTGLLISAGGITLTGNASAVWIFQIGIDFTVANGAIITLAGGARPDNIFWQVAGQVTLGTTVAMKGVILCQTLIEINTSASLVGRALAQTAVTCDGNIVTDPKDTVAPLVSSTVPANAATGVTINSAMTATFNELMDPLTINNVTFTLKQGATPVSGVITYTGLTATFTPSANLASSTVYTATITTGAKDLAGNALASNYTWTFTTGAAADTIRPTVSSTVPVNNALSVAVNSALAVTFSEAMNPLTVNNVTFTLKQGNASITGVITYVGVTATFKSVGNLLPSLGYTATITTGAKDLAGNALAANYIWVFTTSPDTFILPPTVSWTVPANDATDVAINSAMTATFSDSMNPASINTESFILMRGATPVLGAVTYSIVTATFTPLANLLPNTVYTATVTTRAENLAGDPLDENYTWMFTTGDALDIVAPTVTSTVPLNGATGVATNSAITVIFSEAMNPLTINTGTFKCSKGINAITGTVTYAGVTATFTPYVDPILLPPDTIDFEPSSVYTATITTGVKDLAGNPMAADYVWSFTTDVYQDTIAPLVSATINANGATGVPINTMVGATFSEAMDPLTITTITFTLKQGTTAVAGTVTYSLVSAVFDPISNLAANTEYTAKITTGAKDLAGNPMAADYVWSFTTDVYQDTLAPLVSATIHANGAVNVPINTMVGATFSEAMDPLTITTITFTLKQGATAVAGVVTYSLVTAVFNPVSNLAANTQYTVTVKGGASGVKDLAGNFMVNDFVISWTTGLAPDTTAPMVTATIHTNGQTNVAINTMVGATFSEAMDPLTITTVTFTLKQGTTPVAGTVAYSIVSAVFDPLSNLAPSTVYTVTVKGGASGVKDLAGNAMVSDFVISWTTGVTPDTTPPTVTSTINANGAVNVPINTMVGATFSEGMDPLTITTVTFTLKQGTTPVSGAVTYSLVSVVFNPLANLVASTVYTATITTGAKDLAGNPMATDYVWSFTTGTLTDTTAPMVTATINANGAVDVPINTMVGATFSEAMNPLTITTITFTLKQGATSMAGTVTYSLMSAVFNPISNLAASTVYTATITTGAKDLAGNSMAADYVWSFTTGTVADTTAPTVISTVNPNGATDVATNTRVAATFSEAMDPLTITTATFIFEQGTTQIPGTVTYSGVTAVFVPASILAANTEYTGTITTGVQDLARNAMAADYVWSWTTGSALDTTAPTVVSTTPINDATGVAANSLVTATFSEGMDPLTINTITFALKQGTTPVSGTVTYSLVSAVFTPASTLAANTTFTATITTETADLAGNALATDYVWSFDTNPAVIPPANGTIVGTIVDENGDPVQNVTVTLGDTGVTATTNSEGEYTFTDVPPGTYTLEFNASGYELATTQVTVTAGQTTTVPDTILVASDEEPSDDDGSSNLWWILLVIAAVAVAAIVGYSLMNKKNADAKKDAEANKEAETTQETDAENDAEANSDAETTPESDANKEA